MDDGPKWILQIRFLDIRIGTWIAWACFVGGAVTVSRRVEYGIALVMVGVLVLSFTGKHKDN